MNTFATCRTPPASRFDRLDEVLSESSAQERRVQRLRHNGCEHRAPAEARRSSLRRCRHPSPLQPMKDLLPIVPEPFQMVDTVRPAEATHIGTRNNDRLPVQWSRAYRVEPSGPRRQHSKVAIDRTDWVLARHRSGLSGHGDAVPEWRIIRSRQSLAKWKRLRRKPCPERRGRRLRVGRGICG